MTNTRPHQYTPIAYLNSSRTSEQLNSGHDLDDSTYQNPISSGQHPSQSDDFKQKFRTTDGRGRFNDQNVRNARTRKETANQNQKNELFQTSIQRDGNNNGYPYTPEEEDRSYRNENISTSSLPPLESSSTTTTTNSSSIQLPIPNPHNEAYPLILNPPNLNQWRTKLFNMHDHKNTPLLLSESEFYTYFPHVDNVYSHRSTQKYRQKPFISHYWECRLKGRPSGTKKSEDPTKKKRKRVARERDLCDVKIKITEWFSMDECSRLGLALGTGVDEEDGEYSIIKDDEMSPTMMMSTPSSGLSRFGVLELKDRFPLGHPGAEGKRWFSIRLVGPSRSSTRISSDVYDERGGEDGFDFCHKHTLEESDRIKKNTLQRYMAKETKRMKSTQSTDQVQYYEAESTSIPLSPSSPTLPMSAPPFVEQVEPPTPFQPYRTSGLALQTVKSHSITQSNQLIFFANGFCPFAQRVWIALELKEIPYQFIEVVPPHLEDGFPAGGGVSANDQEKWEELLKMNPSGSVPCLQQGNWAVWESGVLLEYLEDLSSGNNLLPLGDPRLRAHCRLWTDHINRKILPAFYSLLLTPPASVTEESTEAQRELPDGHPSLTNTHQVLVTTLETQITQLVNASHAIGPFFLGSEISFVDIAFAPWIIRLSRVLSYYREFPRPEVGTRWQIWVDAIEANEKVRRTISDEGSYHAVYEGVDYGLDSAEEQRRESHQMVEVEYAKRIIRLEGFGLGGDIWGRMPVTSS